MIPALVARVPGFFQAPTCSQTLSHAPARVPCPHQKKTAAIIMATLPMTLPMTLRVRARDTARRHVARGETATPALSTVATFSCSSSEKRSELASLPRPARLRATPSATYESPGMLDLPPGSSMSVTRAPVRQSYRRAPPGGSRWAALVSCGLLLPSCKGGSAEADRRARGDAIETEAAPVPPKCVRPKPR